MSDLTKTPAKWAAIVYGRSYHLDFRFITIPQDFQAAEIAWVTPHIIATTQKARNLGATPRWSLFKNDCHCVVGVTCMVRDLLGKLGRDSLEVMAKDDLGRPLYIFVGYVGKLILDEPLRVFPAYTDNYLTGFKPLYREIEKVWLSREYEDRKPFLSPYQSLDKNLEVIELVPEALPTLSLNHKLKCPDKTFVWQSSIDRNQQLWQAAARSPRSTSLCLNIKGKSLVDSPFLNQSTTASERFTIQQRINNNKNHNLELSEEELTAKSKDLLSLKAKISNRAKDDLNLTLQQAAKMSSASQEIISNLAQRSNTSKSINKSEPSAEIEADFGFKTKKDKQDPLSPPQQDWF